MVYGKDYLIGKDKMNKNIVGHVENTTKSSRKAQLESYEIASKYDAVITPTVVDEAPMSIASTGDAVSLSLLSLG